MKYYFSLIYFSFFIILSYSQETEYKNGTIITNELDTLNVKIEVLNDSQSIIIIKYIDKNGKTKKISTKRVKSYSRGNEYFKTITISNTYKLFAEQISKGVNFSLFHRTEGEGVYTPALSGVGMDSGIYMSTFLENKYGRTMKIPSSKKKFKKRISAFLLEYESVSERVRNGMLTDITEIINLCNDLNE